MLRWVVPTFLLALLALLVVADPCTLRVQRQGQDWLPAQPRPMSGSGSDMG
jgi:hypothetical protein